MKIRLAVLIVLLMVLALDILYLRGAPRLSETSPAAGAAGIPAGTALRLTFSQPMQPDTVTQRLTIDPARPVDYQWEGNTLTVSSSQPWPSGQKVTVRLAPGAKAVGFLPLSIPREYRWSFTIGHPLLAYLSPWDGAAQVFLISPQSGDSQQLTHSQDPVLDYDINLAGSRIYFSASQTNGDSAIYQMERPSGQIDRLIACPHALCRSPKISPKGDFLAYERTDLSGSTPENFPQLWLLTLGKSPATPRLAGDPTHRTQQPEWSPSGQLTYYDSTLAATMILDVQSGAAQQFPDRAGIPGGWNPDGNFYVYPEVITSTSNISNTLSGVDILPATHLMLYKPADSSIKDLTVKENLEDASPVFSPDGAHLAFARRFLDIGHWTPGRQLWLMDPGGGNARQLTQAPFYNHYDIAWSLDSKQLVYTRFNNSILTEPPELWIINTDGSQDTRLLVGGYAPQWVP